MVTPHTLEEGERDSGGGAGVQLALWYGQSDV
jgi:hypothetical protein